MGYRVGQAPSNIGPPPGARRPCEYCGVSPGSERQCINCHAPLDAMPRTSKIPPTPMPSGGKVRHG